MLWYRGRLEVALAWIEARPNQPPQVWLDGLQIIAPATVVCSGEHPVLEIARKALRMALGPLDPRLEVLQVRFAQAQRGKSGMISRDSYLTGERERALTVSEDLEQLSLPLLYRIFLYHLVRDLQPALVLELGTAHGMSAVYVGAALEDTGVGQLHTVDGEPQRQRLAQTNLAAALPGTRRVTCHLGRFADVLPGLLPLLGTSLDFVFDDGPHLPDVTLETFAFIAPHLAPGSVYVMDDIDHPNGNRRAWDVIRSGSRVAAWAELNGRLGLCVWA